MGASAPMFSLSKTPAGLFDRVLQAAARIICSPQANKFHTCSLRGIFCQVHAPAENDSMATPHKCVCESRGSFAPVPQFQKWEIHTVFPHFWNFEPAQNISLSFLADLCGAAPFLCRLWAANSARLYCESFAFTVNLIQMPAARPLRGNRR